MLAADMGGRHMSESRNSPMEIPLEDSMPGATASLESILCTEELQRRPSRPPDYEKENRALVALVSALADSPGTIFQTLADTILDITQCDSAGLSLLTRDGKTPDACGERFYWPAIAGMWNPHVGGGTPRNFGPCGDVLDQNRTLLFRRFERRYPYLVPVSPAAEECLLVPFYVDGKAVGTIWGIMHSDRRRFDAEDNRVMGSVGKIATSAYQAFVRIDDLKFQVSEREKAEAEVRELARGLESKIRRLVEANVVGIVMWNLEGAITAANEAFLHMVQYTREDIASGRVRWTDLTPVEWRGRDERAVADLKASGIFQPFEKEYFRKDGSRLPVLLGGAFFEGSGNEGVAFVLDLSERKRAEDALRSTRAELARAARLATMAALSASIAHEVTQPLAAIITNGDACLRLLAPDKPNLGEMRRALASMIRDGKRAVDVVGRVRALLKKSDVEKTSLDLGQLIREVLVLVQPEVATHRIVLRTSLSDDLPPVLGDRIHLEQVVLNLMTNSIEAMRDVADRNRELTVSAHRHEVGAGGGVLVSVKDTGVGFEEVNVERLFEALYTTKPDGLGMGLSISRSLVEAYQGRLWGTPNAGHGATFQFVLPACGDSMSRAST
jgi:PAS domain S-box-containing protein